MVYKKSWIWEFVLSLPLICFMEKIISFPQGKIIIKAAFTHQFFITRRCFQLHRMARWTIKSSTSQTKTSSLGRYTIIPRKFFKPIFCTFEDFVSVLEVLYSPVWKNITYSCKRVIFFSHKFGIWELFSWVFVGVIRGFIHSTLENYGKLELEGAMKILIIKAIIVLPDGELMFKKLSIPLEDTKK